MHAYSNESSGLSLLAEPDTCKDLVDVLSSTQVVCTTVDKCCTTNSMATKVSISTVTSKGQVTAPAEFRKAHSIRKGSKIVFSSKGSDELTLAVVASLDLAGVDSKRLSYKEASKNLDRLRENDRD